MTEQEKFDLVVRIEYFAKEMKNSGEANVSVILYALAASIGLDSDYQLAEVCKAFFYGQREIFQRYLEQNN